MAEVVYWIFWLHFVKIRSGSTSIFIYVNYLTKLRSTTQESWSNAVDKTSRSGTIICFIPRNPLLWSGILCLNSILLYLYNCQVFLLNSSSSRVSVWSILIGPLLGVEKVSFTKRRFIKKSFKVPMATLEEHQISMTNEGKVRWTYNIEGVPNYMGRHSRVHGWFSV